MPHLLLALAALLALPAGPAQAAEQICVECLHVRVGPPVTVRGPFTDELDNHFTALRLDDGSMRGFSANGATYALRGAGLTGLTGPRRKVLGPGPPGGDADCGRWLNGVHRAGRTLYGFIHQEQDCDYGQGRTRKSMGLAVSSDDGLTWSGRGTVLSGRDEPAKDRITGEGDCTWVDADNGFLHAYCLRNSDWKTIVARAPRDNPAPGAWRKFYGGAWREPGLGGRADALGFFGTAAAYLKNSGQIALLVNDPWFGGVRLALSAEGTRFVNFPEPLIPVDGVAWDRPAPTGLIAYLSVHDPETGVNRVGDRFQLATVHVPPGADFDRRYLVVREVRLAFAAQPAPVKAGIALARWRHRVTGVRRVSATPVLEADHELEQVLGYLLTRPRKDRDTRRLIECTGAAGAGSAPRLKTGESCGDASVRKQTAGWLYATPEAGTLPLVLCETATGQPFASTDFACEKQGIPQTILGYLLAE